MSVRLLARVVAWMRCRGVRACLPRISALSAVGYVAGLAASLLFGQVAPTSTYDLDPAAIGQDEGFAYRIPVGSRAFFPWQAESDQPGGERRSTLVLYEDGRPLTPAHQSHERVRAAGGGAYSHWGSQLLFSASDGSDPRTNGRQYRAEQRWQIHPGLPWITLGCAVLAVISAMLAGIGTAREGGAVGRHAGAWIAALLAATLLLLGPAAPTIHSSLAPGDIRAAEGQGWQSVIGPLVQFPFAVQGDSVGRPFRSNLTLSEDGKPLGPGHAEHSVIHGGGAGFSHWGEVLLFATSDGSDPRYNGRAYGYTVRAGVAPSLYWFAVAVLTATVLIYVNRLSLRWRWFLARGTDVGLGLVWPAALLAMTIAATLLLTLGKWEWAQTTTLSAAGYLPLSDAHANWTCARQIAATGVVMEFSDGCASRITYPAMLASLIALSNWQPYLVYLFQALLIAVAVATLSLQAARLWGAFSGILVAGLLLLFAAEHALGTTMTEVAGLTTGTAALALTLFGAERRLAWAVIAGLALLAVALVARAGAMFILPALLLWAIFVAPTLGLRRRWAGVLVAGALFAGTALQFTLVSGLRLNSSASFGNFSVVLYGLASGGKGWSHVYKDHPEVFAQAFTGTAAWMSTGERSAHASAGQLATAYRQVYRLALDRIRAEPGVFISALIRQVQSFWHDYFALRPLAPGSWAVLKGLVILGFLVCLWHWRSPVGMLMIGWVLGEAASAALLADGGMRLFAASVGGRVILAALGLSVLLRPLLLVATGPAPEAQTSRSARWSVPVLGGTAGGAVIALAMLPALHLLPFGRLPSLPAPPCPDGQLAVVTRLDRESPTLMLVDERRDTGWSPLRVRRDELVTGMAHTWFADEFAAIPLGTTLVSAMDRFAPGKSIALAVPNSPEWLRPGVTIGACVDPEKWFPVAGRPYHEVVTLTRLPVP